MALTVLHIDHNHTSRQLVRRTLEKAGYTVLEATSGLDGLKAAMAQRPDLVLVDLNVPGLDGFETATRLTTEPALAGVPVVALTARGKIDAQHKALAAGCRGHITCPINVTHLPQQVAEFLAGKQETLSAEEENRQLRAYVQRLADRLEKQSYQFIEANQALAHTDTMKSRFIKLAAHELRTPLAGLRGYVDLLIAAEPFRGTPTGETGELIAGINSCIDRLQGIVQDMLDMARIESGTLKLNQSPLSLGVIFRKLSTDFTEVARTRQQTLTLAEVDHLPLFQADGERLLQILRNLVSNAIKYTPNGGTVTVAAEIVSNPAISPGADPRSNGQYVRITVVDTGVGVAAYDRDRIFESFYEVRDIELHSSSKSDFMGSGAGLGLPIARGVAQAHGGMLWVESPGHDMQEYPGSQFHLLIPFKTVTD
jgi:signal transduction histidine kinase